MNKVNIPSLVYNQNQEDVISCFSQSVDRDSPLRKSYNGFWRRECLICVDGYEDKPNADRAAQLTFETAYWAYKHVNTLKYYVHDRRGFLRRIFRTVNIFLWQKRQESIYRSGLSSGLVVVFYAGTNLWFGCISDFQILMFSTSGTDLLYPRTAADNKSILARLGDHRYGLVPRIFPIAAKQECTLLIISGEIMRCIIQAGLINTILNHDRIGDSENMVSDIIRIAKNRGLGSGSVSVLHRKAPSAGQIPHLILT
ncbi:hypothetical protein A2154_00275 [Candidatus Gottesmanbacteria bacterium RBG_16_43_7]|uniref:PPM-type phosphatase domain-containing protein n=1 Tax=Candidatus Gottesmanbacteria bacterium RBG_16_43_7 TaxID=1798373 RepID=A0A1F5ZA13_9BACT|nr:MAG: hypothetical protein A2154_00275 [Candidatus Gottesmanbacteria bacterium RBG_16_43_7]